MPRASSSPRRASARSTGAGFPPSIGVIPYVGLNFAVYGTLKDVVAKDLYGLKSAKDLDVFSGLACGGVAGAIGQTVAYPFDVCRRKLQVSGWKGAAALADKELAKNALGGDPIQRDDRLLHQGCQARGRGGAVPRSIGELRQGGALHRHRVRRVRGDQETPGGGTLHLLVADPSIL